MKERKIVCLAWNIIERGSFFSSLARSWLISEDCLFALSCLFFLLRFTSVLEKMLPTVPLHKVSGVLLSFLSAPLFRALADGSGLPPTQGNHTLSQSVLLNFVGGSATCGLAHNQHGCKLGDQFT